MMFAGMERLFMEDSLILISLSTNSTLPVEIRRLMRRIMSLALMVLVVTHLLPAAYCPESMAIRIAAIPEGAQLEVHLKNQQTMRGTRGPVSDSGFCRTISFTLARTDAGQHQIAFDDVARVKQLKSHLTRNIPTS